MQGNLAEALGQTGRLKFQGLSIISNTKNSVISISKHQEESCKYDAQRSIFDEIRGVPMVDETLSRVFDLSSQSEQKLRSKRRSKIVKIYAN